MKGLGWLNKWIQDPNLWHLHRRSVARAFLIGLFWMAIPIPSQMVAAAVTAISLRANLAISIALVWISNPLTMPPIFYFNYEVGAFILNEEVHESISFELTWEWLLATLETIWQPLYLGSAVVGLSLGIISFFAIHALWRYHVIQNWTKRYKKQ